MPVASFAEYVSVSHRLLTLGEREQGERDWVCVREWDRDRDRERERE